MKYFEFGRENSELMVMLHGGGVSYRGILPTAQEMAKVYRVVLVAYDGFNPDEPETEFKSPLDEARRLGDYIVEHHGGKIDILYAISYGCRVLMEVLADARLTITTAIADGMSLRDYPNIRSKWGTIDYTDIMDFTDAALHRYADIDASRVGVCGGSYGGFMANWIIGHTNRFAAACAQRSFSNMINFEYLSDIGLTNIRSEHLGSCEQDVDALWNESPLKYAPNCNTPTLFIHSDEDWRCPLPDALEMFSCLKRAGCPARLCLFHGENHELSRSGRPDNRITRLQEILNWFKAYLQ